MIADGITGQLIDAVRQQKPPGACGERREGGRGGTPPGHQMRTPAGVPQARLELTSELLANPQLVCVQQGPLDGCPQGTARLELCSTLAAAFEVT
jgi:hypothetical protein